MGNEWKWAIIASLAAMAIQYVYIHRRRFIPRPDLSDDSLAYWMRQEAMRSPECCTCNLQGRDAILEQKRRTGGPGSLSTRPTPPIKFKKHLTL